MIGIGIAVPQIICLGSAPLLHKAQTLNGFDVTMSINISTRMMVFINEIVTVVWPLHLGLIAVRNKIH
ncbi:aspartate kinase [Vibrio parahaemolyticus]|nr:aspartate kinase [Vibrio parahaemolyticus]